MKTRTTYLAIAAVFTAAVVAIVGVVTVAATRDGADPVPAGNAAAPDPAPVVSATPPSASRSAPAPAPVTYAGRTVGGAASIAIAVDGSDVVVYVCDGRKVEAWYQGSTDGGTLALTNAEGATLTGTLDRGTVSGALRAAGRDLRFEVRPVAAPGGLFRAVEQATQGAATVIGWIVLPDGQVGIARRGETAGPAPALDPARGTAVVDGRTVRATAVTGAPVL